MIICSSSNIDLIQGVSGYGTVSDGATDWRIENTSTGVFNILNSPNLLTPNVSIIDAGNIGIGTIPVTGTNKLQVQGDTSVTGQITTTRTTAGTNDILAMRYDSNNGIRFQQTLVAANDVRYDIIQKTNNADYTTPAISIYKGNVGIGTNNPNAELQITCTSTATNPDTAGTIIGLYVHNPSNTATQNSVILNRIAGTTAGKVIYAFNVLNSHGCSLVMNGNDATDKLLRFNSNATATGTDLMVINNTNGNVSIGNVVTTTYKLNITGDLNVSGGYFVAGTAFKPATAVLADSATKLATSRTIALVGFDGTAAIDIPYFNLTNKITSGTGISITTGSAVASPVISTNLTAGTNVTFTGTAPNITINAAGGTSQWTTSGANIYYNSGNVGIGTNNPLALLDVVYSPPAVANTDMLNIRVDGNWGLKLQQSFTVAGNIQYNLIHRYNTVDYNALTFKGANVGIGTNNPGYRLEVVGGLLTDVVSGITNSYMTESVVVTNNTNANHNRICAKFNNSLWVTLTLVVSSDSRIKEDIQDINDDTALQSILSIEPKSYKYVDKLQRGDKKVFGFIAQQIKEVIPEAVIIEKSYIPNIYLLADYIDCVITLSSRPTQVIIKMNDKIKCYDKDNKEILVEVIEVIDYLTFRIKEIEYTDTKIFVYGTFVDDFHTLDKTYIFTLNVCATQELHRRIEAQSVLLKSQDDRIKDLETKVATLLNSNA